MARYLGDLTYGEIGDIQPDQRVHRPRVAPKAPALRMLLDNRQDIGYEAEGTVFRTGSALVPVLWDPLVARCVRKGAT